MKVLLDYIIYWRVREYRSLISFGMTLGSRGRIGCIGDDSGFEGESSEICNEIH